jgi:peptide/nickel transport system permease protein
MARFLLRRLVLALFVAVGVVTVVFFLIHLSGDPTGLFLPPEATPADRAVLRRELGLDRPLAIQYLDYVSHAIRGDFGRSMRYPSNAMELILARLPATIKLTTVAMSIALCLAVPLGIVAAVRKNSVWDFLAMSIALFGQSIPNFWTGIMLILLFSVTVRWFPPSGGGGFEYLVLPGVTLGLYSTAVIARLLRSSLLEVFLADYIRTARAKGLSERLVTYKHALRNASLPVVTVIGLQVGTLLGGAVVTEYVFAYPGVGRLVLQAISNRDFPVVQAFVVTVAVTISAINLLVDLSYALLDPRIRYDPGSR